MATKVTPPGAIREIILDMLQSQPEISFDVAANFVAGALERPHNESLERSISKTLHHMRTDGIVNYDGKTRIISVVNGSAQSDRKLDAKSFVQSNPTREKVQLSPYLLQRKEFVVTLETSPLPVERVVKVEKLVGDYWQEIEIDEGHDLRVCFGQEKPMWSPYEATSLGVTKLRLTLKTGEVQVYDHNPNVPFTTLRKA